MNLPLIIFIAGILCTSWWLARRDMKIAVCVLVFLAPWYGLDVDYGLRLTAFQIFLVSMILVHFYRISLNGILNSPLKYVGPLVLFLVYAVIWTISQLPHLPHAEVAGGFLRSPNMRSLLQIPMLLLSIAPFFIVKNYVTNASDFMIILKSYIYSALTLALLGWLQLFVWYGTGTNPFPIGFMDSILGGAAEVREGSYDFFNLAIYRMNSFGGEPKGLGAGLVIGVLLLQILLPHAQKPKRIFLAWLFLVISMTATFSTTAFFLWVIGTIAQITAYLLIAPKGYLFSIKPWYVIASAVGLLGSIYVTEMAGIPIREMVLDRTIDRVNSSELGAFEDFDSAIKDFLLAHPARAVTGVGLGNIHLYANSYLLSTVARYAEGGVYVAKAQYLRIISETGLIGLTLILYWIYCLLSTLKVLVNRNSNDKCLSILFKSGFVMIIIFLAAGSVAPQFYIVSGAITARLLFPSENILIAHKG